MRARRVPASPSAKKAEDTLFRLAGDRAWSSFGGWVAYVLSIALHVVRELIGVLTGWAVEHAPGASDMGYLT